jgi:hypothetical protein
VVANLIQKLGKTVEGNLGLDDCSYTPENEMKLVTEHVEDRHGGEDSRRSQLVMKDKGLQVALAPSSLSQI